MFALAAMIDGYWFVWRDDAWHAFAGDWPTTISYAQRMPLGEARTMLQQHGQYESAALIPV